MSFRTNITTATQENPNFRKVLFTGAKSQLVAMRIPPGGEIGEETHAHVEQTLFCLSGQGTSVLDGDEAPFGPGDVVVVTPGTRHNFLNAGDADLVVSTVYAPPNHLDGTIHKTKADADVDTKDEAFGQGVQ